MELMEGSENTVGLPRGVNHIPRSSSINSISGSKLLKGVKKQNPDLDKPQQKTLAEVDYLNLNSIAKIVKDFENV